MTTRERKDQARKANRERISKAVQRVQDPETYREEVRTQEELSEVGCFQAGRKRFSIHACEYNGAQYFMLKKVETFKSGKARTRRLTFNAWELPELMELIAQVAGNAEKIREQEMEEVI